MVHSNGKSQDQTTINLKEYRKEQRWLAFQRDDGLCQICLREHNRLRRADDVHHVFGRSRRVDWREHHTSLMCVCRECHPSPLYLHNPETSDHEIAKLMRNINKETQENGM